METCNNICHVEYFVTDLARSQAFYEGLFGWTFRSFMEEMVVFANGDSHIGGLLKIDAPDPAPRCQIWYRVEDLDSMMAKATRLGGTAKEPKSPVPGVGFSTEVLDPDGNRVGLVQYVEG